MSDNVRDKEVRDEIAEIVPGFKKLVSRPDYTLPYQLADQIITLIRKEGYMHPDDLVEGMVVATICPLKHLGEYCKEAQTKIDCKEYPDEHPSHRGLRCYNIRPATLQEVLDKKAVPA